MPTTGITGRTTWRRALAAGWTRCVRVRALDGTGTVSGWSRESCSAAPLPDRSLRAGTGWDGLRGTAWVGGRALRTASRGATISVRAVRARSAHLVARTCPRCGSLAVLDDGRRVARVDLRTAGTRNRVVLRVRWGSAVRQGRLTLVATSGREVTVDGLALEAAP